MAPAKKWEYGSNTGTGCGEAMEDGKTEEMEKVLNLIRGAGFF